MPHFRQHEHTHAHKHTLRHGDSATRLMMRALQHEVRRGLRTHSIQVTEQGIRRGAKLRVTTRDETELQKGINSCHGSRRRAGRTRLSSPGGRCKRSLAMTTANLLVAENLSANLLPFLSFSCCAPPTAENCNATAVNTREDEHIGLLLLRARQQACLSANLFLALAHQLRGRLRQRTRGGSRPAL